ncbi:hypothetical protein ACFPRL_18085 [Pseudoclavibacter helvolus]
MSFAPGTHAPTAAAAPTRRRRRPRATMRRRLRPRFVLFMRRPSRSLRCAPSR